MHTLTSCPCVSPENAAQCAALGKSLHPRLALVLAAWHTGPPPLPPPRGAASAAAATVTPPSAFLSDLGPTGQPRITSRLQSLHLTTPAASPSHEGTLTGPERQDATWLGTRCSAGHTDHALSESSADRGRPECGSGRLCQQRGHDDEEMGPQQPEQAPLIQGGAAVRALRADPCSFATLRLLKNHLSSLPPRPRQSFPVSLAQGGQFS